MMNYYFDNYADVADSAFELDLDYHGANRRKMPRTPCMIPVHFNVNQRLYSSFILDINKAGVCVQTDRAFDAGAKLLIQYLDPYARRSALVSGRIAWSNDTAMGVKLAFHPFTPI